MRLPEAEAYDQCMSRESRQRSKALAQNGRKLLLSEGPSGRGFSAILVASRCMLRSQNSNTDVVAFVHQLKDWKQVLSQRREIGINFLRRSLEKHTTCVKRWKTRKVLLAGQGDDAEYNTNVFSLWFHGRTHFYLTSAHYTIANEKSITETHSCNTLSFVSMTIIAFAARHRWCCRQAMQNGSFRIQRHKGELKL